MRIRSNRLAAIAVFLGLAVALVSPACGGIITWTNPSTAGGQFWNLASNWGGTVPASTDNAVLTNGGKIDLNNAAKDAISITDVCSATAGMIGSIDNGWLKVNGTLYADSGSLDAKFNTGALVKNNTAGSLVLNTNCSRYSTFSSITVNGGSLVVNLNNAAAGNNGVTLNNGSQLILSGDGATARTFNTVPITGNGSVTINNSVRSNAVNTYSGVTTINTLGKLTLGSGSVLGTISGDLALNGGMLSLNSAKAASTYAGNTSGTGIYEKIGVNLLTASGQFEHTGGSQFCGPIVMASSSSMLFDINDATNFTKVTLAVVAANTPADLTLNGSLKFNVTDFADTTGSWNVFDASLTKSTLAGAKAITYNMSGLTLIDGASTLSFTKSSNVWQCLDGSKLWKFTEGSGLDSPGTLSVSPVPEPSTIVLLSLGLLGAVAYMRRRS